MIVMHLGIKQTMFYTVESRFKLRNTVVVIHQRATAAVIHPFASDRIMLLPSKNTMAGTIGILKIIEKETPY